MRIADKNSPINQAAAIISRAGVWRNINDVDGGVVTKKMRTEIRGNNIPEKLDALKKALFFVGILENDIKPPYQEGSSTERYFVVSNASVLVLERVLDNYIATFGDWQRELVEETSPDEKENDAVKISSVSVEGELAKEIKSLENALLTRCGGTACEVFLVSEEGVAKKMSLQGPDKAIHSITRTLGDVSFEEPVIEGDGTPAEPKQFTSSVDPGLQRRRTRAARSLIERSEKSKGR